MILSAVPAPATPTDETPQVIIPVALTTGKFRVASTFPRFDYSPESEDDLREIQLLIDDRRSTFGPVNISQRVAVKLVDLVNCDADEWRADASDILSALQRSIGKFSG